MAYAQDKTILAISTPFGADAVLLVHLHGVEGVSELFHFELDLISHERALDFASIVGKGVTVTIRLADGKERFVHGICTRFVQAGRAGKQTSYRAELRPQFWLLGRTRDSRIFQEKSTTDIIEEIFKDNGLTDYKLSLKGSYSPRPYCVQYQESSLDFVTRLMEDEGIHYYFEHEDGKHTLVLADDSPSNPACPNFDGAKYTGTVSSAADHTSVIECTIEEEVVTGKYATTDYNFETPDTALLATIDGASAKLEVFEYPGNHPDKGVGDARAKLRIEEEEALGKRLVGTSLCRAFTSGFTFSLSEHERDDANADYLLRSVVHTASNDEYRNHFEALPKDVPFRPRRITPRPLIYGTQTALVVGKKGEEIWTDEYGRIKVQFYWDRKGKKDENSSCFIRVAQGWAGKGWGAFFLPRIGQEVIVSFLEGDPDRPLVTGSVYNASQTVPYALPDDQTKSTVLSRSSKKGSAGNELRFEDKKDSEEVYVHAQKDMVFEVENDWTMTVKHDQATTIKNDRKVTIEEGNETFTVSKGDRKVTVEKGNEAHSVKGTRDLKIDGDETHKNKGNFTHNVKGDYTLKIDGNLVIEAKAITIKAQQAVSMKSGTDFKAEAGTALDMKSGTDFKAKAGTSMTLEGAVAFKAKGGAQAAVEGGGMLTLKGGMVKIN